MRSQWNFTQKAIVSVICFFLTIAATACSTQTQTNTNTPPTAEQKADGAQQSTDVANSAGPKTGGILRLSRAQDISSLDPIQPTDNMSLWTILNMFDQLVRLSTDGKSFEPGLATEWKVSDDGKTYTFNLRTDVQFHDGSPVTPKDVKFSLDRARGKESNWNWMYGSIDSVDVAGDNQITIKLKEPYVPLLSTLALFSASIVPEKVVKEKGKEFANSPVGSGPFMFDSWQRGQKVVLKKNPNYWQKGKPYLDGVEFQQIPEDTTKLFKLQAKEIDVASDVPFSSLEQLKSDPSLNVIVAPFARLDMIPINTTKEPFNDVKIRQAMNYAINKDEIVKAVLLGNGEPANSYLPKVMYFNDQLKGYTYDLEKAKQLLAQSSKPNGFKATLTINAGNEINSQVAVILKEQLKAIGIELEIQQLEPGVVDELHSSMKYDLVKTYYSSDVIDPDEMTMFGAVYSGGTKAYYTGYQNPKMEELAVKAQKEMDENKRKEMYFELQRMFSEDAPFLFLYHTPSSYVAQKYVEGFNLSPMGSYRLEEVWLNQ